VARRRFDADVGRKTRVNARADAETPQRYIQIRVLEPVIAWLADNNLSGLGLHQIGMKLRAPGVFAHRDVLEVPELCDEVGEDCAFGDPFLQVDHLDAGAAGTPYGVVDPRQSSLDVAHVQAKFGDEAVRVGEVVLHVDHHER
jgi:hypothetical protein